jgi:hypothetical protein
MGLLSLFGKSSSTLFCLPSGSFTIDRGGKVVVTTVSSSFPKEMVREIGLAVIATFRGAHNANLPLTDLTIHFGSFKITARELRGGAIVFLAPSPID